MKYRIESEYRSGYGISDGVVSDSYTLCYFENDYPHYRNDKGAWLRLGQFKTKQDCKEFAEKHKRNYIEPEEFDV